MHADFLTLVLSADKLAQVRSYFDERFGQAEASFGHHGYEVGVNYAHGVHVSWSECNPDSERYKSAVCVNLPGEAFKVLTGYQVWMLCRRFGLLGARCTRLDVACDDGTGIVQLADVLQAMEAGDFCGPRVAKPDFDIRRNGSGAQKVLTGCTFGRRGKLGGGRSCCIYDKGLESGEFPAGEVIRVESRFYKDVAAIVFPFLVNTSTYEQFTRTLASLIPDAIDFREAKPGPDRHKDRRPRLPWWEKLVSILGQCARIAVVHPRAIERSVEWIERCVMPLLASLRDAGETVGFEVVAWVEDRLRGVPADARRVIEVCEAARVGRLDYTSIGRFMSRAVE